MLFTCKWIYHLNLEMIFIFTLPKYDGIMQRSYDQCVSYTRCSWLVRRCRTISRDSKFLPTTIIVTLSIVGTLKRLACSLTAVLSVLITILWLTDGIWSNEVLNNEINSLCWWKNFFPQLVFSLNCCVHNTDQLLVVNCSWN